MNIRKDVKQEQPELLSLFTEHSHVTSEIFNKDIIDSIKDIQKNIITLHITDQLCYNNYELCLKAQISITGYHDYNNIVLKTLKIVMSLVEKISADYKLPESTVKMLNKRRKT